MDDGSFLLRRTLLFSSMLDPTDWSGILRLLRIYLDAGRAVPSTDAHPLPTRVLLGAP